MVMAVIVRMAEVVVRMVVAVVVGLMRAIVGRMAMWGAIVSGPVSLQRLV